MKRVNKIITVLSMFGLLFVWSTFAIELNSGNIVDTFGCATDATSCDLSNQGITSIAVNTFVNHTVMNSLVLDSNEITSIEPGAFSGLLSLNSLSLAYNHITSIDAGDFTMRPVWLPRLRSLTLLGNEITTIHSGDFSWWLSQLQQLHLWGNHISLIHSDDFTLLPSLTTLVLSQNNIVALNPNTFLSASWITTLDLSINHLTTIVPWTFSGLSKLTFLDLSYNYIKTIGYNDFTGIPKIATLEFDYNNISSVADNTFLSGNGFSKLTSLNLSPNCNITQLAIPFKVVGSALTDFANCIPMFTADGTDFINALEANWYVSNGDYEVGNFALSFEPGATNQFLAGTIMQSYIYDVNLSVLVPDLYPAEVQYETNTSLSHGGAAFTGILNSPILFSTGDVPGMTGVVSLLRLWAFDQRIDFDLPVTIRMPALGTIVDDTIGIYSSEETNIYGSQWPNWVFEQTGTVYDNGWNPYVTFTTNHASRYVLGTPQTILSDTTPPTWTIVYSPTSGTTTSGNVVATISLDEAWTITNNGWSSSYTFTGDGTFTFEFSDLAWNTWSATATVNRIDTTTPTATIIYTPTSWSKTSGDVIAIITLDETGTITNNWWLTGYTFTGDGTFTFEFSDLAWNTWSATATVDRIDKTKPVWTITYSPTSWSNTSGDVVATITLDETGTITNNGWLTGYTFTGDWTFTFTFEDLAWNTWSATATVNRIDKTAPTWTITYSPISWSTTSGNVVATISLNETGTITNNSWLTWYTFTGNGTFTFQFADLAGNTGSATATVNRIDKTAPTASTITYNITWTTNQDVIATITWFSETITWLNFSTHTFTSNGTFVFTFQDLAGNTWSATATVTWIDKTPQTGPGGWPTYIPPQKPTTWLLCSAFSAELNGAYTFAFTNGITTIKDCKQANLEWTLQRSHLAKMISQFAVKVMNMKIDTTKACSFSDIGEETPEIQLYIKVACQLGLMGYDDNGNQNKTFDPFATVNRAQFGTILSRVLRGTKYNGADPYYLKHLNALKAEGIMKNISQPFALEMRWRVMLMLQRIGE